MTNRFTSCPSTIAAHSRRKCSAGTASQPFIDAAATPPHGGGECATLNDIAGGHRPPLQKRRAYATWNGRARQDGRQHGAAPDSQWPQVRGLRQITESGE